MKILLRLLFCTAISLVILAGCRSGNSTKITGQEPLIHHSVNDLDGVTMSFKGETTSSNGGTVILTNKTDRTYTYGESFSLEKKVDAIWDQVPVANKSYGISDIGYELNAADVKEWTVDWGRIYGKLENGNYRLVKDISYFRNQGDSDMYYLTAEFIIQ